jgi:hypothetical protein
MPTKTTTDAERQARREADRQRTREAVDALRASDGWQTGSPHAAISRPTA